MSSVRSPRSRSFPACRFLCRQRQAEYPAFGRETSCVHHLSQAVEIVTSTSTGTVLMNS